MCPPARVGKKLCELETAHAATRSFDSALTLASAVLLRGMSTPDLEFKAAVDVDKGQSSSAEINQAPG